MATRSIDDAISQQGDLRIAKWPAAIIGTLVARSFGLAAGVALAILLAAALFSVR